MLPSTASRWDTRCAMTARYTGEIPTEDVRASLSMQFGIKIVVLENMENELPLHAVGKLLYNQA